MDAHQVKYYASLPEESQATWRVQSAMDEALDAIREGQGLSVREARAINSAMSEMGGEDAERLLTLLVEAATARVMP